MLSALEFVGSSVRPSMEPSDLLMLRAFLDSLREALPYLETACGARISDASDMRAFLAEACAELSKLAEPMDFSEMKSCLGDRARLRLNGRMER